MVDGSSNSDIRPQNRSKTSTIYKFKNSGFLRPNITTLPESLRGVDLINLNPPTIGNSNLAQILSFFLHQSRRAEMRCIKNGGNTCALRSYFNFVPSECDDPKHQD
ncbi:hypothetical protein HZS_3985 [Henneguya salminicola]|nr:hypothetical protein HZS_3985 [Henneguya salminicola]